VDEGWKGLFFATPDNIIMELLKSIAPLDKSQNLFLDSLIDFKDGRPGERSTGCQDQFFWFRGDKGVASGAGLAGQDDGGFALSVHAAGDGQTAGF